MEINKLSRIHLSIHLLLTLVVSMTLFTSFMIWYTLNSSEKLNLIQTRNEEIVRLQGQITHYDEVLTMSARMAAATGDKQWEQRYRSFEPLLDMAIKKLIILQPNQIGFANETDEANTKLVEMENKAFLLTKEKKQKAALDVLFSVEYEKQKEIYSHGVLKVYKKIAVAIKQESENYKSIINYLKLSLVLLISVTCFGWGYIVMKVRGANRSLRMLNEELDQKVKEQTENLVHSFKMSSIGEMAAGIAHEINNPLTIISATCSFLKSSVNKNNLTNEKLVSSIDKIEKTIVRMTKIIQGLKNVSRDSSEEEFASVLLRDLMTDVVSVCSEKFYNNGVQLLIDLNDPVYDQSFDCRRVQMSQIFINLLGNSFDAIENLPEKWSKIECLDVDGQLIFKVIDSGHGISKEIQEKIFLPFFTTKPVGKGTGLGLSLSISIIRDHAGTFLIDNQCPNTCFVITLPKKRKAW